jgi:hypothetical protein
VTQDCEEICPDQELLRIGSRTYRDPVTFLRVGRPYHLWTNFTFKAEVLPNRSICENGLWDEAARAAMARVAGVDPDLIDLRGEGL